MANPKDCPPLTNSGARAKFADEAVAEQLEAAPKTDLARLIANWKADKLPKANADNAARLHTHNRKALREAGAVIDEHRAGEGRETYNAKRRDQYADDKATPVREYVTGLSDEAKAERRREQKRAAEQKRRAAMTQADRDAEALRKKLKRKRSS